MPGTTPLPFTVRGVGRVAIAPIGRLFLIELVVALAITAVFGLFVNANWFSQITTAIGNLPGRGELNRGVFLWQGDSPVQLAGNKFIAFAIDPNHEADLGHEADLCVELGYTDVQLHSLLGYTRIPYPKNWRVTIERTQLEPWWNAWAPVILLCACATVMVILLIFWAVLAIVYMPLAALIAFLADRKLTLLGGWKLASAAQMPGALCIGVGILLYGVGWIDLVKLGGFVALQFFVVWFFVLVTPFTLERVCTPEIFRGNPFAQTQSATIQPELSSQSNQTATTKPSDSPTKNVPPEN